jgi:hypothetical protein
MFDFLDYFYIILMICNLLDNSPHVVTRDFIIPEKWLRVCRPVVPDKSGGSVRPLVMIKHPVRPIIDHEKGDSAGSTRSSRGKAGIADSPGSG